ncbi:deleted in malignant brain tumors 1 protein-like [Protopterus annectens]|uniref:deleted in malignant brain tumors 1 protein-like n=1 Tax=Protopterus annectens TaxID=7888 RepID=UPI001CFBD896|nr:deleted in malignant brain tumors 1 protein-like [Protopterus annectens]
MEHIPCLRITILVLFSFVHLCTSENISIRLGNYCSGQLEVYSDGKWKPVCTANFNINHTKVACRQLSCGIPVSMYSTGGGYGDILLSNLECNGSESSFSYCLPSTHEVQNCTQNQSVVLTCSGPLGLQFLNSQYICAGDVFVYSSNFRGYISAEGWDISDADVVCRQSGCGFALTATSSFLTYNYYNTMLKNVGCLGTEYSLQTCPGISLATNVSSNASIAHVICSKDTVKLQLVNGTTDCSGRVEIYNGLSWESVCGSNWGMNEAKAVCAQLHCGFPVQVNSNSYFGQGSGDVFRQMIMCSGNEISLFSCNFSQPRPSDCTHAQDASVICSGLQLTNGTNRCNGILEVNNGSQWGGACNTTWSLDEARVVCRELRCGYVISGQGIRSAGGNQQPVLLNNIQCSGWENSLSQCSNIQLGNGSCSTSEVAAVQCSGETLGYFTLRLADGGNFCSGRVEIYPYRYSTWGTISGSHWDIHDANLVCKYLRCGFAVAAYNNSEYGSGSGPVWLDVNCYGNESSLLQCSLTLLGPPDTKPHTNDAAVMCTGYITPRIVNGTNRYSGRVEIFFNNTWNPVSTEGWDINDANVVCRSQGYGFALAAINDSSLGIISSSTWFKKFQCSRRESRLNDCHGEISTNVNISSAVAGVTCSAGNSWMYVLFEKLCVGAEEAIFSAHILTSDLIELLARGNTFIPSVRFDLTKTIIDLKCFVRKLNLDLLFSNEINDTRTGLKLSSIFNPPLHIGLRIFEKVCEVDFRHIKGRVGTNNPLPNSNITKEQRMALNNLNLLPVRGGLVILDDEMYIEKMSSVLDSPAYSPSSLNEMNVIFKRIRGYL